MVSGASEATMVNETTGDALNQLVINQPQRISFNSCHSRRDKDLSEFRCEE